MVDVRQERHLEDAVVAIEPRVTGRAFPDTATRACGVADSGTSRTLSDPASGALPDSRIRTSRRRGWRRRERCFEDAVQVPRSGLSERRFRIRVAELVRELVSEPAGLDETEMLDGRGIAPAGY